MTPRSTTIHMLTAEDRVGERAIHTCLTFRPNTIFKLKCNIHGSGSPDRSLFDQLGLHRVAHQSSDRVYA
jgi:hypothetical protein